MRLRIIGEHVKLTRDIHEEGEDLPPGVIAHRGEIVVIRRLDTVFDYAVSHPRVTDRTFGVNEHEIESTQADGRA